MRVRIRASHSWHYQHFGPDNSVASVGPVWYRMFSSIPGIYLIDVSYDNQKYF